MTLGYASKNKFKFQNALDFFEKQGVVLEQKFLQLDEIQSESGEEIALHKVRDAFTALGNPVFVNDASWHIPALGGFPGPYMKYIVEWLSENDILRLMQDKQDRTIILKDVIAYKDKDAEKVFVNEIRGQLLALPEGAADYDGPFINKLISLTDGKSLALEDSAVFNTNELPLWNQFADWLKQYQ